LRAKRDHTLSKKALSSADGFGLSPAELRTLRALKTPPRIQKFIDALTYQYADTAG
jgi:hypothetical protein